MAATSETLTPGARVEGRYELRARLGDGTFGEVWQAADTRFGTRLVAVKFLKPEFLDRAEAVARFENEANALVTVSHPNVVQVLDKGEWGGRRYIVMEFVEGRSLEAWLGELRAARVAPPLDAVRDVFDQLCAGVAAAHAVTHPGPVVHRDLKPANVMLRDAGGGRLVAKVLDFGIARYGARNLTQTGGVMGTLLYMAPEQGLGNVEDVGPWTDVFALGVMLTEMLAGTAVVGHEGKLWWSVALQREHDVRPILGALRDGVPPAVWDVVAQALRRDGRARLPSAGALGDALRAAWRDAPRPDAIPPTVAMPAVPLPPAAPGGPDTLAPQVTGHSVNTVHTVALDATQLPPVNPPNPFPRTVAMDASQLLQRVPEGPKKPPAAPTRGGLANLVVPGALALALVAALVARSQLGTTATPRDAGAADAEPERPTEPEPPPPAPAPAESDGEPRVALFPSPSSPDPRGGSYSLAQATEGTGWGPGRNLSARIETSLGALRCTLWPERAPQTVANFVGLARARREFWDPVSGAWVRRPFYDGSVFHRVIPGFMIQGGDWLRSGRGRTGYQFPDENTRGHDQAGLLCMANSGPHTNGGQFFIMDAPAPHLDGSYSIFGVCEPVATVHEIAGVARDGADRPRRPVAIRSVTVTSD